MGRDRDRLWTLVALLLLTSCGGSKEAELPTMTAGAASSTPPPITSLVVVRHDWDRDAHPDVLTLDTSRNPLVIVEAIRGTEDGAGTNATDTWRGGEIEAALNDALHFYIAQSRSVGSQTDLELILDGAPVTVTVIE